MYRLWAYLGSSKSYLEHARISYHQFKYALSEGHGFRAVAVSICSVETVDSLDLWARTNTSLCLAVAQCFPSQPRY